MKQINFKVVIQKLNQSQLQKSNWKEFFLGLKNEYLQFLFSEETYRKNKLTQIANSCHFHNTNDISKNVRNVHTQLLNGHF